VDIAKLRDYSLNPAHPEGKHKARVFLAALGLTANDAGQLRQIILNAVIGTEAVQNTSTLYGQRFVIDFAVVGRWGTVTIRTAWIVRNDENFPRMTSCYIP
jgi:hypothetical protein